MGNCGSSVNCTAVNLPVEANNDVAGIGILVAFVANAVITFIANVVGYLSDSLPDAILSQLDRACIAKFSAIRWRPWTKDSRISLPLRRSMTVTMGVLGWDSAVADSDKGLETDDRSRDARERRSKALVKFILALSDQQLVTGIAVLIAGFVSQCSLSGYHFRIITALGCLSSATHLLTLALLRVHFLEHPRLRNWRTVAMLLLLALLTITLSPIGPKGVEKSLPARCGFTLNSFEGWSPLSTISEIGTLIFLVMSYSDKIVLLYSLDPKDSFLDWLADSNVLASRKLTRLSKLTEIAIVCSKLPQVEQDKIRRRLKERQQYVGQELVKIVIESSRKTKAEQAILWQSLYERRRYTKDYDKLGPRRSGWWRWYYLIFILMSETYDSVLGDLLMLLCEVVYCVTWVITSRVQEPRGGIVGSQNEINFGQSVSLVLMLLPVFAAGEFYFERREDMLTRPLNDKIKSPNLTHKKPFCSHKVGLADIFRLFHSTQPGLENTKHTVHASSFLQRPESMSCGVGGSTSIEFQSLPTGRLRRSDTEIGLRASMTDHSELARTQPRSPVSEIGVQPAKATEKPSTPWQYLCSMALLFHWTVVVQNLFAISIGEIMWLAHSDIFKVEYLVLIGADMLLVVHYIHQRLKESGNP